jgi:hypothetical protein
MLQFWWFLNSSPNLIYLVSFLLDISLINKLVAIQSFTLTTEADTSFIYAHRVLPPDVLRVVLCS